MVQELSPGPKNGFTIDVDSVSGMAVITMTGRIDGQRFGRALDALAAREDWAAEQPRLWDLREADLSQLTRAELRHIAVRTRHHGLSVEVSRVATVVSREVDFGIGRMFELTEGERLPGTRRTFRDLASARSWLTKE